jgi:hypothetical protein
MRPVTVRPMTIEVRDYLPFATSLCGAFFGALGAYWVGRFKEKRDEKKRRHTALLATQYALFSQWNVIEDVRRSFLESVRKDPQRHLKQKYFMRTLGHLAVPFDDLAFIIDSKEPNLLQDIHIAEKRFLSSVELLEKVNKLRLELQNKYPPLDFDPASGKGHSVLPAHELFALKELTDSLYNAVDKALPDLWNTNQMVFDFVKKHLKGRKAAKFVPIEQPPIDTKSKSNV